MNELNSFLRTVAVLAGLVLLGFGGWELRNFLMLDDALREELETVKTELTAELKQKEQLIAKKAEQIKQQQEEIDDLAREIERQRVALEFLKLDRRVAKLDVLEQVPDPDNPDRVLTRVRFSETGADGNPVAEPIESVIEGKQLYVDAEVIRFRDEFVEKGHELRGRAICRFRRMFGEYQRPTEGTKLDKARSPADQSDFEKQLWANFWAYANDPGKAEKEGIHSASGSAQSMKLVPGNRYTIEIRATGGMSIRPEVEAKRQASRPR